VSISELRYAIPADLVEHALVLEFFGKRDFVERLAALVEREEGQEDRLVQRRVKVGRRNDVDHGRHHLFVDQHRAEECHLRLDVVGRNPVDAGNERGDVHRVTFVRRVAGRRRSGDAEIERGQGFDDGRDDDHLDTLWCRLDIARILARG